MTPSDHSDPSDPGDAGFGPGLGGGFGAGAGPYGARRLSPRVLLIDPIRLLPSLFLPLAGVLLVGGFSPASFGWAALAVVASAVYAVVRWATFTYDLTGDRLELTRAFIGRTAKTIPLERIRGIDITEPPLHRLLGLAVLKIDTGAGGNDQEGTLDAVTMEQARALRTALLARRPATPVPAEATGPTDTGPEATEPGVTAGAGPEPSGPERAGRVLARVPRRWLRYGPLSGAYLLTPFALAAGAAGLVFQWGEELGLTERSARQALEWVWAHPLLLVAVGALLLTAMPIVGAVMYAIFNWDFTLRTRDGYLVAERGLLTRRTVSLERRRIRGYEMTEALFERWAGVVRLWAVVTGLGDSATRGQLLPVTPKAFATGVASEAVEPFVTPLRPHPPRARQRRLVRAIVPWLVLAAVAFALGWAVAGVVALGLAVLGIPLGLDRYRGLGHAYDGAWLSVRSGSLRRVQAVVERRAVVGWTLRQTAFQRLAGLITVTAGVGAGSGGYPAIDTGETQGVEFAAEVTPDWLHPFLTDPPPPPGDPSQGR
ncbi:PH domain-containing protein [Sphaerimonospora thailandensis]|uniref:YdbS-like PH domain-containing protein n=1 Tax=Sphaerimonospora thailandensis TaxID=795644 RepID=A0A8J3R6L0_9ACTN|nr:PH domain-containing protein [Sphaerimonospora thailandensis]GIH69383.1 hypothetical protein Mth01_16360 [Sphaerimonospora thailandensis]